MVPLIAASRMKRYHVILHHHSFAYIDRESRLFRLVSRIAEKRLTHVCLSQEMALGLAARYGSDAESIVCSNAAILELTRRDDASERGFSGAPSSVNGSVFVVGHLGNLSLDKGLLEVIDLARVCAGDRDAIRVEIAGGSYDDQATQAIEAAQKDLQGTLVWHGHLDGAAKDRFYQSIDLFILPTRYANEAEPLVVLEASNAGVPTAAYARGCIGGMLGGAGLAVAPGDSFSDRVMPYIDHLICDDEFRVAQSQAARRIGPMLVARSGAGLDRLRELLHA